MMGVKGWMEVYLGSGYFIAVAVTGRVVGDFWRDWREMEYFA